MLREQISVGPPLGFMILTATKAVACFNEKEIGDLVQVDGVVADLPFSGSWLCLRPPGHHPHAMDFMKVDQHGRRYPAGKLLNYLFVGIPARSFYCWGEPVLAPFDGVVVRIGEGWADRKRTSAVSTIRIWFTATFLFRPKINGGELDIRPNVGNYVMVKSAAGAVALLAHLRSGSINVRVGQLVGVGQKIGEVGNSGNATAPHIHINLFDQVDDLLSAHVVPLALRRYDRWDGKSWETIVNGAPGKREIVRSR